MVTVNTGYGVDLIALVMFDSTGLLRPNNLVQPGSLTQFRFRTVETISLYWQGKGVYGLTDG